MTISLEPQVAGNLLRNGDAASYLGVSPNLLRLSRHTGELFKGFAAPPYVKMGHAVRYRQSSLDQWLAALPEFESTADYQSSK